MGSTPMASTVREAELNAGLLVTLCAQWKVATLRKETALAQKIYQVLKTKMGTEVTTDKLPVKAQLKRYYCWTY